MKFVFRSGKQKEVLQDVCLAGVVYEEYSSIHQILFVICRKVFWIVFNLFVEGLYNRVLSFVVILVMIRDKTRSYVELITPLFSVEG